MSSQVPKPLLRMRARGRANASGFPLRILALFLAATIMLGFLLSWALNLSVQVDAATSSGISDSEAAAGIDDSGLPVLTENAIGPETQHLIDTGTLQNPASFDVTACLDSLGVSNAVLMLEEVSWVGAGRAWLLVHAPDDLASVRANGGEVSAAVVPSTCGAQDSTSRDALWTGTVLVDPQS